MTDIYVPIDYSNLKSVIPPGEDIIYSTSCEAVQHKAVLTAVIKKTWNSHVLMTTKGFAFMVPQKNKTIKAFYTDWYNIKKMKIGNKGVTVQDNILYKIRRDPDFESVNEFKERSKIFVPTIRSIAEARRKEWESKVSDPKDRKSLAYNRKFENEL